MNPVKKFLIGYVIAYLVLGIAIHLVVGGTSVPEADREQYKADVDVYWDIVKSDTYKLWTQSPEVNPPDDAFSARLARLDLITGWPVFQKEQRRKAIFDGLFDFFNFFMGVVLIVRFGRKPLLNFLDQGINDLREKIEVIEENKSKALARKAVADERLTNADEEKDRIASDARRVAEADREAIEKDTREALVQIDADMERRKILEERTAVRLVKEELISVAIEQIGKDFSEGASERQHAVLVDQFIQEIGDLR